MIDELSLPVGSCVRVLNQSKMVMIAGYLPYDNQTKVMYDYIGIYVPIGIRKPRQSIELNKDYIYLKNNDIEKIVFIGLSDNKSEFYRRYLLNIKKEFNRIKEEDLSTERIKKLFKDSLLKTNDMKSEV